MLVLLRYLVMKKTTTTTTTNNNLILGDGWSKYWSYWPPSPHPHPGRQQKSPARGEQIRKTQFLLMFNYLDEKVKNTLMSHF